MKIQSHYLFMVLLCACGVTEQDPIEGRGSMIKVQSSEETRASEKKIFESSEIETAEGLQISLWASDSLAPDPIAMSIDDFGRVYVTRTNRQKNSEFDIRGYEQWMTASISLQSVEDRRAFLRKTFDPAKSAENNWLPDLNNDGSHDWLDLMVEKDEVWRMEDTDGDGLADKSVRIVEDFNEEISDVAGALLVRREDMFVGVGPDMWRLTDTDSDGIPDKKESISHGYAVHIGFGAHGMSGVIQGPDGKIYWGIGDIGANITTREGVQHKYPNQGIIVRSNPDGSQFEVFAHGLRNTHEFVFDAYGNIISSDNDGDHPGESERLVHIVEGSDAGWRSNWQYGKYTDPKNNDYKVWMDERLFVPRWDGQAAYIIPPIQNFHNGPTGMVFNPGSALGSAWKNNFFLVEFVGNPSRSPIWAFTLAPKGASFVLEQEKVAVKGILPTGIRFGPDGALYAADWVNGWGTKNYGRVWKVDVPSQVSDMDVVRAKTKELMAADYKTMQLKELGVLLGFGDLRIRQKAQFELANRGEEGAEILIGSLKPSGNEFLRIHAIWGLGQMAANDLSLASELLPLLDDRENEIVAQTAKVLGDIYAEKAGEKLTSLLKSSNPRVQFYSAQALGRLKELNAVDGLLQMLEANDDRDLYLRHAAVLALARIGSTEKVIALKNAGSLSMRTAGVLVLRQLSDAALAEFLSDKSEYIVTEAARAIHDDWSVPGAMPSLAALLGTTKFSSEPLLRRILSACQRLGGDDNLDLVLAYARRSDIPKVLKAEALSIIGTWASPSVLDRVDGRNRGEVQRDPAKVVAKIKPNVASFLGSRDSDVVMASSRMLADLHITDFNVQLASLFKNHESVEVRSNLLMDLSRLEYIDMESMIQRGMEDEDEEVRGTALGMLDQLDISRERLPEITKPVLVNGSQREQQKLLGVLGIMPIEKTEQVFSDLISKWELGQIAPEIKLDILEAIDSSGSVSLKERVSKLRSEATMMDQYAESLYGGDGRRGWQVFNRNPSAQCTRCHSTAKEGEHELASVGPSLSNIGNSLTREQLLEAVIEPSARIAPGFGVVMLTLTDDQVLTGTLLAENEDEVTIKASNPEPIRIQASRISKRENLPSSMPPMASLLSKMEIRDLVEYLSGLKVENM